MKAQLPHPEHYSYQLHRKQAVTQIILPIAIAGLLFIGLIVLVSLATFRNGGDVTRWAEISTMWIIIPMLILGLVFLILLVGLVYVFAKLLGVLPTYTGKAQDLAYRLRSNVIHAADVAVRPIIGLNAFLRKVSAFLGRD